MSDNRSTKFKVGDKVRVLRDSCNVRKIGEKGEIVQSTDSRIPYNVKFETADEDGDNYWWYNDNQLELFDETKNNKTQVIVYDGEFIYKSNQKPIKFFEDCCSSKITEFLQEFLNKDEYELYSINTYNLSHSRVNHVGLQDINNQPPSTFDELKEKLINIIGIDDFNKIFEKIELINN